jgi:hypothetical protein
MVCVDCGKPYQMKTQFTVNSSAGEWHGKEWDEMGAQPHEA